MINNALKQNYININKGTIIGFFLGILLFLFDQYSGINMSYFNAIPFNSYITNIFLDLVYPRFYDVVADSYSSINIFIFFSGLSSAIVYAIFGYFISKIFFRIKVTNSKFIRVIGYLLIFSIIVIPQILFIGLCGGRFFCFTDSLIFISCFIWSIILIVCWFSAKTHK
jgi:hypothetical protein